MTKITRYLDSINRPYETDKDGIIIPYEDRYINVLTSKQGLYIADRKRTVYHKTQETLIQALEYKLSKEYLQ